jgi:hypothetical protein
MISRLLLIVLGPVLGLAAVGLRELDVTSLAAAAAAVLVLCLPGYVVSSLLFRSDPLVGLERLVMAISISIAASIIVGLSLHISPWSLSGASWAVGLSMLCVAGALWLGVRAKPNRSRPARFRPAVSWQGWVVLAASLVMLLGAYGIARYGYETAPQPEFTQLWAVPDGQGPSGSLEIGVRSWEPGALVYRVAVLSDGEIVSVWQTPTLQRGQAWTATWAPHGEHPTGQIVVELSAKSEAGSIFRQVAPQGGVEFGRTQSP